MFGLGFCFCLKDLVVGGGGCGVEGASSGRTVSWSPSSLKGREERGVEGG